jgi:hypothetical protein
MDQTNQKTPLSKLKIAGMAFGPVLLMLVAAGVVLVVSERMNGFSGVVRTRVFWAFAVSGLGTMAWGATLGFCGRYFPEYLMPQGVLAAMTVRMFITLAGIMVFVLILPKVGLKFFLLCTVGFCFIGLISETIIALSLVPRGTGFHAHPTPERKEV